MAITSIGHRPELTIDAAREIFARGVRGRYDVISTDVRRRDFIVRKDAWCGVGVRLQQRESDTQFVFTPMIPEFWLHFFFGGMFAYFALRKSWKAMEAEVALYIQSEPEFHEGSPDVELMRDAA